MPTWLCRNCGTFNEADALRCVECGSPALDQPATEAVPPVVVDAAEPPPTQAVPAAPPEPPAEPPTAVHVPVAPPSGAVPPAAPPPEEPPVPVPPPSEPDPSSGGTDKRWWIAAGVAAVLIGALLAALVMRDGGSDDESAASSTTASTTTTEPPTTTSTTTTTTEPATTTTTEPPLLEIDQADLRAGTYRILCPGGEVTTSPDQPEPGLSIDGFESTVVGDISGDGRPDAVVAVSCSRGNSGRGTESVIAVSSERAGPTQLGDPIEGYDPQRFEHIIVVTQRADESTVAYRPFRSDGGVLAPVGGPGPNTGDRLQPTGFGDVKIGQTFPEMAAATGLVVSVDDYVGSGGACVGMLFEGGPADVSGLGSDGTLRTLGTTSAEYRTEGGLRVGDTGDDIVDVLPDDRLEVQEHPYDEAGEVVIYRPEDHPDRVVVFDTDGTTIITIRVGEPEWSWAAEGCA